MTGVYDAATNAILASTDYAKNLSENDFDVNGIVIVITDGADNQSSFSPAQVKDALQKALKEESLESLVSILVGVGTASDPSLTQYLEAFKNEAGITQYIDIKDANAKTLAKLAQFVSKSVSAQSQALGTGGPSKQLSLTI